MITGNGTPLERSGPQQTDARDLTAGIARALAATPVDEQSLRCGVWSVVGRERQEGTSPGHVILALTELVDASPIAASDRRLVMQRVILWCVEAYFGHLGGDTTDAPSDAAFAASAR